MNKTLGGGWVTVHVLDSYEYDQKQEQISILNISTSLNRTLEEDSEAIMLRHYVKISNSEFSFVNSLLYLVSMMKLFSKNTKIFQLLNFFELSKDQVSKNLVSLFKTKCIVIDNIDKYAPKLENLFSNIFGKGILTRDIEQAQRLALEYKVNCASSSGEVVFAGGYLARLGTQESSRGKIVAFNELRVLLNKLNEYSNEKQQIEEQFINLNIKVEESKIRLKELNDALSIDFNEQNMINERLSSLRKQSFSKTQELFVLRNELAKKEIESRPKNSISSSSTDSMNKMTREEFKRILNQKKKEQLTIKEEIAKMQQI